MVRRHLWLQRCVWGSKAREQGAEGNIRKGKDGCPSGVAECNVNPRAGTVIFLFLVTHKCTKHQIEKGERGWTEGNSEKGTHGQRH